jgi:hypothetical protein
MSGHSVMREDLDETRTAASLDVTVAATLAEPGRVFGGLPAVRGWKAGTEGSPRGARALPVSAPSSARPWPGCSTASASSLAPGQPAASPRRPHRKTSGPQAR